MQAIQALMNRVIVHNMYAGNLSELIFDVNI